MRFIWFVLAFGCSGCSGCGEDRSAPEPPSAPAQNSPTGTMPVRALKLPHGLHLMMGDAGAHD